MAADLQYSKVPTSLPAQNGEIQFMASVIGQSALNASIAQLGDGGAQAVVSGSVPLSVSLPASVLHAEVNAKITTSELLSDAIPEFLENHDELAREYANVIKNPNLIDLDLYKSLQADHNFELGTLTHDLELQQAADGIYQADFIPTTPGVHEVVFDIKGVNKGLLDECENFSREMTASFNVSPSDSSPDDGDWYDNDYFTPRGDSFTGPMTNGFGQPAVSNLTSDDELCGCS